MIHGSKKTKKVKTQEEVKSETQLSDKIIKHLNEFLRIRNEPKTDIGHLNQFTEILMQLCSDIPTIYNFRRQLIDLQLNQTEDQSLKQKIIEANIKLTTKLIKGDPKSYTLWSIRQWLVVKLFAQFKNQKVLVMEHELCKMMLLKDQKNFHVWNYRNWLHSLKIDVNQALNFTHQKIKTNPFNFSPFHFRTKHLFQKYSQILEKGHVNELITFGMEEKTFNQELEMIKTAIFLNPQQQAPWLYYKWLINLILPFGILRISRISPTTYQIILNERVSSFDKNMNITSNGTLIQKWSLDSKTGNVPSNQWVLRLEEEFEQVNIDIKSNYQIESSYIVSKNSRAFYGNGSIQREDQIKRILEDQIVFIGEVLQSQDNKCRYAAQVILKLKEDLLFFCKSRAQWQELTKDVDSIFENMKQQTKGRKYIEKIEKYWENLMHVNRNQLTAKEIILLDRLL